MIFKLLIGQTMKVYIDDMITKSKNTDEHMRYLEETFTLLRKYKIKLYSEKYIFGVSLGKFMGFMVSHKKLKPIHRI